MSQYMKESSYKEQVSCVVSCHLDSGLQVFVTLLQQGHGPLGLDPVTAFDMPAVSDSPLETWSPRPALW